MEFTIADGVVAIVVIISALLAYNRGLTREVLAIGGWIVAAIAAFYFAPMVSPLVLEIPYADKILRSSCTLTSLASFVLVFGVALIILSIFTPFFASAVHSTPLASVDRGLGFIFGVARGVLLVAVVYLLYDALVTENERLVEIDASASHAIISDLAETIKAEAPTTMPEAVQSRIDALLGACGPAATEGGDPQAFATPYRAHG